MAREDFRFNCSIVCRGSEREFLETIVNENGSRVYFERLNDGDSEDSYKVCAVSQEYVDYILYEFNKFKDKKKKMNKSVQ